MQGKVGGEKLAQIEGSGRIVQEFEESIVNWLRIGT
jgi:hypothetical protein